MPLMRYMLQCNANKYAKCILPQIYTVSQKVPTFKLSVTYANQYSNFSHC